ncbi:MAG: hypothetical protein PF495_07990 [Spirochaetales bacterium]|jgi:hypothetical protein|nr:hypothetical protein [Spirochaetales bacterium]
MASLKCNLGNEPLIGTLDGVTRTEAQTNTYLRDREIQIVHGPAMQRSKSDER